MCSWFPSTIASPIPPCYWLSEASAVLLADELQARGVGAITRRERVRAFEQLHLPLSASLSRATLIKVGELVGASEVIVGTYTLDRDTLKVDAHTIRIDVGRLQPDVVEQAPLNGLISACSSHWRVGLRRTRGRPRRAARHGRRLAHSRTTSKGLIAESPAAQATFLETAVRLFAGYDRAELALWDVRTEQGDHAAALAAARAVRPGTPLGARARFLSGVSLLNLKRYDEAFDLFKALVDVAPVPPLGTGMKPGGAAFNNLGVVVNPAWGDAADGHRNLLPDESGGRRRRRRGLPVQSRIRLRPRAQLPGRRLLAA